MALNEPKFLVVRELHPMDKNFTKATGNGGKR